MNILEWLTLLFIAFKLTGVIDWYWIWILSPYILYALLEPVKERTK